MNTCTCLTVQKMSFLKKSPLSEIAQKIAKFESEKEATYFLKAFLTPKELKVLCDRYKIVELLLQKIPQREISKKLGVSISQISRGSEELQFGNGIEFFPKFFEEKEK